MILGIDAGHGMANARAGVFDPGAIGPGNVREADVVLAYALMMRDQAITLGMTPVLVRSDNEVPAPLSGRVAYYTAHQCDALISLHCNASENPAATGTETLYHYAPLFADAINRAVLRELGLRNRGIKARDKLEILRFPKPAALVELGFISNPADRDAIILPENMSNTTAAILFAVRQHIRA